MKNCHVAVRGNHSYKSAKVCSVQCEETPSVEGNDTLISMLKYFEISLVLSIYSVFMRQNK
jgi:hypothetical protein